MAKKKKKKTTKPKARKAAPKQTKEDVFYVGVRDPVEIRRNVLECSKEMVQFLQRYESLKAARDEKTQSIHRLREDVKEIKSLMSKLKKALPKTKLRIKLHEEPKPVSKKQKTKKKRQAKKREAHKEIQKELIKTVAPPKTMTEIEKLESELADIEGKLGHLS
ncbi:hypothetical protein ACFLZB_01410 [Nanoarchaeota archaeon]